MTITVAWYDRTEDFKTDYKRPHVSRVRGRTAAECMEQIADYRQNIHNLARYTPIEIVNVED